MRKDDDVSVRICLDFPIYVTPKVQTILEYRLGSWYIRPDVLEYQLSLYFRSWYSRTSSYSRSLDSRPKASHLLCSLVGTLGPSVTLGSHPQFVL